LRRTRQELGIELADAAASLRLRPSYLEAIEAGDYDRLPGATYVVGFVRAYAEFLGLDGAEAVRRFKREGRGLAAGRGLSFPMPLTQRSVPGGRILLLAAVLAVCGYGVWYYVDGGGHRRHLANAVPATLFNASVPSTGVPPSDSSSPSSTAATPPPPEGTAFNPPSQPNPAANVSPALSSSAMPVAPAAASSEPPADALSATPAEPPALVSAPTETGSANVAGLPPPSPPEASVPAPLPSPRTTTTAPPPALRPSRTAALTPPAIPTSPIPDATEPSSGAIVKAHIQVRAVGDVWMEVRDQNNAILVSHVLHKGEVYRVPQEAGLTLKTGRIEELAITVDGRKVALPTAGKVRTLALDPVRLAAGTAVLAPPAPAEGLAPAASSSPAFGTE